LDLVDEFEYRKPVVKLVFLDLDVSAK
jgi:hypothetical protein